MEEKLKEFLEKLDYLQEECGYRFTLTDRDLELYRGETFVGYWSQAEVIEETFTDLTKPFRFESKERK